MMRRYNNIYILAISLALIVVSIGVVGATDICLNPVAANTTCYMVTPTLICAADYNYTVYDNDGVEIRNGTLETFNQADLSYFFNFSEDAGTYYVGICDGSTRQIIVGGDTMIGFTDSTWFFLILIGLFVLFLFMSFKVHPIFMFLDGIIFAYFGYYSYATFGSIFILVMMVFVAIALWFISIVGSLSWHQSG